MRHLSLDEAQVVGGAGCGDLTVSVGLFNASMSGSGSNWYGCFVEVMNWFGDTYNSIYGTYASGIPYGEPHVG